MFASSEIHRSGFTVESESRGIVVFWRYVDEKFLGVLESTLGFDLEFLSVAELGVGSGLDGMVTTLSSSPGSVLPRQDTDYLHWLVRDGRDEPLLLVRQKVSPRSFDERWVTGSVLVFVRGKQA